MRITATILRNISSEMASGKSLVSMSFGRADAGYADGVGTDAEAGFEVLGVHEQSREVVPVGIQTEQYADTHVVDAAFHRAVHRFGVIGVVALRAGGVECFVSGFVVGFLEENVGADACIAQFAVVLDRRSRDIYVHAADRPVLVMYGVDRLDRFENVLDRIVARVLSGFECQTLVTHILQRDNLAGNLFLRQLLRVIWRFSRDTDSKHSRLRSNSTDTAAQT
mgnify:CR=1 FL=1